MGALLRFHLRDLAEASHHFYHLRVATEHRDTPETSFADPRTSTVLLPALGEARPNSDTTRQAPRSEML